MERLRLVLVGTEGAINLGMIARLAENFDVDELYLVKPTADLREAEEFAARSAEQLRRAQVRERLEEALEGTSLSLCTSSLASAQDVLRSAVSPGEAVELAREVSGTVALVMGRESVGLTREELRLCTLLVTIGASPRYPVLNLANATAIMLYELFKVRGVPHHERAPPDPKTVELVERYAREMAQLLISDQRRAEEVAMSFRRLAAKGLLERVELENVLLLLSRASRALRRAKERI
ncbi:MAG: rRNA methylase [Acidilobaceae archaeon]|nr:rRNA methylase [Acidilobaceae archaeon]MCX8166046.1 rRNA methylase [Acidilobaceae archaeon]MDW7974689.1 TrmH family RNA methyltransferase [Sulfolobales archaeon]